MVGSESKQRARRGRTRMSSAQRREQLIEIARGLFAERGYDGASVEEIAARAEVSKPVVYEHFGGKQGLYAVVVDREVQALEGAIKTALSTKGGGYRRLIEAGALALLDYIDTCPDGFRIISRDSSADSGSSFASILSDIVTHVEDLLITPLSSRGYNPLLGRAFAQGLVGMVASAGQSWLDERRPSKDILAAQLVNLIWNGLANLEHDPVSLITADAVPTATAEAAASVPPDRPRRGAS